MADKRISSARIRDVWHDPALTTAQAAEAVGLTRSNLWRRAKALGLAPRRKGNPSAINDDNLFREMWEANVACREIARYFRVHWQTPTANRRRLGLPARVLGGHQRRITLEEFFSDRAQAALAKGLASRAEVENRAFQRLNGLR